MMKSVGWNDNFQICDGQDAQTDQPKSETKNSLGCGAAKGEEGLVPMDRKRARPIDKGAERVARHARLRCKTVAREGLPV